MKEIDFPWPKKGDKLFEWGGEDWWNNAYVGSGDWDTYADGYKHAGDVLVEYVNEQGVDQDSIVYPTVFLYRHAIELKMKWIIHAGGRLIGDPRNLITNHDFKVLWKECRDILEKVWPKGSKEDLDAVEDIIKQFSDKDPKSMAFRYPVDKRGNLSVPDLEQINLRILKEIATKIYNLLDGASTGISEYLEREREMESYYSQEGY